MVAGETLVAGEGEAGLRLDAFVLSRIPTTTRAFVRDALASGAILLNGRAALKGARVHAGDRVDVGELLEAADNRPAPDSSVRPDVVYDDGSLLAVDKPAGLPVQPLSPRERGTLVNGLVAWRPSLAAVGDEPLAAGTIHRIDAGTSGLVLVAETGAVFSAMRRAFAERRVEKTYLALVEGRVARPGAVSGELVHDPRASRCRMVPRESLPAGLPPVRALFAETSFRPLHGAGPNTLLEVTIRTGVTHQIRAQLSQTGHPIVGDVLYGARPTPAAPEGTFRLHSLAAAFDHPVNGRRVRIAAPPPAWAGMASRPCAT